MILDDGTLTVCKEDRDEILVWFLLRTVAFMSSSGVLLSRSGLIRRDTRSEVKVFYGNY